MLTAAWFQPDSTQSQEPQSAGGETRQAAPSAELAQLVRQVRANEELYRNLETVLERTVETAPDRDPDVPLELTKIETRHTVRQDKLIRFEGQETLVFPTGQRVTARRLSLFDGDQTVSIEFGNSVNIHHGRYEASQVVPPHSWALEQWGVNFPLSVFLEGTEAIRTHPKHWSHPVETGALYEFARVECRVEGTEQVMGLACARVECKRWYRSNGRPIIYVLWLATDRNYLCVKAQRLDEGYDQEAAVEKMEEISPGVWLPKRVIVRNYWTSLTAGRCVSRRELLEVSRAVLNPVHPVEFFRQSTPEDLPVYRMVDGRLDDSPLLWPPAESGDEQLKQILAAVRNNEAKYASIETKLRGTYRTFPGSSAGMSFGSFSGGDQIVRCVHSETIHRSVIDPNRVFTEETETRRMENGTTSRSNSLNAFDGQWTRWLYTDDDPGHKPPVSQRFAGLQPGVSGHVSPFRPHSAALRRLDTFQPLSEILESLQFVSLDAKVEYLGRQTRQGLSCDVLRLVGSSRKTGKPYLVALLWLARDRCYLPVRDESYTLRWNSQLPTAVTEIEELRELSPGVFFPMRVVTSHFESYRNGGLADDRLTISWQQEWIVDEVTFDPEVESELFEVVNVPAGTQVSVSDADGEHLGSFKQPATGNIVPPAPEELDAMRISLGEQKRDKKERLVAMDALLGRPAPAFPNTAWLNSEPLTWEQLKGKVVLVEFWATWCGPCRLPLSRLARAYDELSESGVVVIGVHTAGSKVNDVETTVQDENLRFPICIDVPPPEGRAWGAFFQQFAVRQIPYTYVVDRDGKIVAHGDLMDGLYKARSLAKNH